MDERTDDVEFPMPSVCSSPVRAEMKALSGFVFFAPASFGSLGSSVTTK